jgi:hypothetical protein
VSRRGWRGHGPVARARRFGAVVDIAAASLLAGLMVSLLDCPVARAQPRAVDEGAREAPLDITVVGTPGNLQWARSLVGPRSLGSTPRWARVDSFDPAELLVAGGAARANLLGCWLDLSDPRRARLYFAARSGERFLVRDVELSGRFDELDRESLAEVLALSIAALRENQRAGLTRAETEALLAERAHRPLAAGAAPARAAPPAAPAAPARAAAPPPTAGSASAAPMPMLTSLPATSPPSSSSSPSPSPSPSPAPLGLQLGAFYAAQALSPDLPVAQGPGLLASAGGAAATHGLSVWLSGQYQLPATQRGAEVGLRVEAVAARAGLQLGWPVERAGGGAASARRWLIARLGAGVDFDHLSPQPGTTDPSAVLTPARWSSSLVVSAAIGAAAPIGRRVHLAVELFADLLPTAVRYDLNVNGNLSTAFASWRLRPGLALGLTFR